MSHELSPSSDDDWWQNLRITLFISINYNEHWNKLSWKVTYWSVISGLDRSNENEDEDEDLELVWESEEWWNKDDFVVLENSENDENVDEKEDVSEEVESLEKGE